MPSKKLASSLAVFEANIDKNRARGYGQDKSFIGNITTSNSAGRLVTAKPTPERKAARRESEVTEDTVLDDSLSLEDGATDDIDKTVQQVKELSLEDDQQAAKPKASSILRQPKFVKRQASMDVEEVSAFNDKDFVRVDRNRGMQRQSSTRILPRRGSSRSRPSLSRRCSMRSIASSDSCDTYGSFMGDSVDTMGSFGTCDSAKLEFTKKAAKTNDSSAPPVNAISARMGQKLQQIMGQTAASSEEIDLGLSGEQDLNDSIISFEDDDVDFVSDIEEDEDE